MAIIGACFFGLWTAVDLVRAGRVERLIAIERLDEKWFTRLSSERARGIARTLAHWVAESSWAIMLVACIAPLVTIVFLTEAIRMIGTLQPEHSIGLKNELTWDELI